MRLGNIDALLIALTDAQRARVELEEENARLRAEIEDLKKKPEFPNGAG